MVLTQVNWENSNHEQRKQCTKIINLRSLCCLHARCAQLVERRLQPAEQACPSTQAAAAAAAAELVMPYVCACNLEV